MLKILYRLRKEFIKLLTKKSQKSLKLSILGYCFMIDLQFQREK